MMPPIGFRASLGVYRLLRSERWRARLLALWWAVRRERLHWGLLAGFWAVWPALSKPITRDDRHRAGGGADEIPSQILVAKSLGGCSSCWRSVGGVGPANLPRFLVGRRPRGRLRACDACNGRYRRETMVKDQTWVTSGLPSG